MRVKVEFFITVDEDDADGSDATGVTSDFYEQISDAAMQVGAEDLRVTPVT